LTQRTVNTLIRMDDQKIRTFIETVHRTDFNAVSIFTTNTVISNDESHGGGYLFLVAQMLKA
ncbi:hypothetical protein M3175_24460, partial [Robertmurraya korlensis]|nr:hypothetical protein [Robertmurraya korlensis]